VVHEIGGFEDGIQNQRGRCNELYQKQKKIDQKLQDCLHVLSSLKAQLDEPQKPGEFWPVWGHPAAPTHPPTANKILDLGQLIARQRKLSDELQDKKRKIAEEYKMQLARDEEVKDGLRNLAHVVRFGISADVEGEYQISLKYGE